MISSKESWNDELFFYAALNLKLNLVFPARLVTAFDEMILNRQHTDHPLFRVKEHLINSVRPESVEGQIVQTLITRARRSWFDKLAMNGGINPRFLGF